MEISFATATSCSPLSEVSCFTIQSQKPHSRVSWQVTGIRHDPWANAHRIPVVVDKPASEQGTYVHPEL